MDLLRDYDSLCDPRGQASPPGEASSGKISGKKIPQEVLVLEIFLMVHDRPSLYPIPMIPVTIAVNVVILAIILTYYSSTI